jgi:thioesterase domain-containing protein
LPAPDSEVSTDADADEPTTALEEDLARIWTHVLGVARVGVHDDFFDLGGHSLLAVQMLLAVERELGRDVPVVWMLEGGATIAGLAALISSGGPDLVRTKPGLVFIWSGEPAVLAMRHLRTRLGSSAPIAALFPADPIVASDTVAGLADAMLLQLREHQPAGPYALAGFSFGGLLAYEIAGRLLAAGEQIDWLAVLDAPTPSAVRAAARIRARFVRLIDQDWSGRRTQLADIAKRALAGRLSVSGIPGEYDPEIKMLLSLVADHSLAGHDAPLELFATDTSIWRYRNLSLGWAQAHLGPLTVNRVSGDHDGMLRLPAVDTLAELMAERFRSAAVAHPDLNG